MTRGRIPTGKQTLLRLRLATRRAAQCKNGVWDCLSGGSHYKG